MKRRETTGDRAFTIFVYAIVGMAAVITLYPFIYVFSMSISDPMAVNGQEVWLLPKGFSTVAYGLMLQNEDLWSSYGNTIWYTLVGTTLNVLFTVTTAYPLSNRKFSGRMFFSRMLVFTMYFSGGMIPSFILITRLGLYNTRWAIVIPGLVSVWNMVIARSFFEGIPESLKEAATIDGCTDVGIFTRIVIPNSMAIIAVLTLYYAVGHWNSYFNALLYLPNKDLHPVQVYLMRVLSLTSSGSDVISQDLSSQADRSLYSAQLKYALIMVVSLPIIFSYTFLQKYFVKGVMIGSIKG